MTPEYAARLTAAVAPEPAGLPGALLDAAFAAIADSGSGVMIVTCAPAQPSRSPVQIHWANRQARTLLADLAEIDEPRALELLVRRGGGESWTAIVAAVIAGDLPSEEWHTVRADDLRRPESHLRFKVSELEFDQVVPLAAAGANPATYYLVWVRSAGERVARAEEIASEADFRFRTLSEHAPVGILLSDVGLRLGFVNEGFASIVGLQRESLLGTGWLDIIHAEDLPEVLDQLHGALEGATVDVTVRMYSVRGAHRWVRLRVAPVTTRRRAAGFVGTVEDITDHRDREELLAYQARHDALTGLANRRYLMEALTHALASRRRLDSNIAVLFCDVDHFKQVNDAFGHDVGDRLLIAVARRLDAAAREGDLVARIAGDEFVVLLRHVTTEAEAEAAAGRHLNALVQPLDAGGAEVEVSVSIGYAVAAIGDSPTELLRRADSEMYRVKRSGRGIGDESEGEP
jgi:diguanylate cyclase (GGDEF)-like protein/PAS domain S-box-containing protein